MLSDAEIGQEVARRDDRLLLVDEGRRRDAGRGPQGGEDVVHGGEVLAGRSEPLGHEGDGVEAQRLRAPVGEEEHGLGDGEEDLRVVPVEVPLVRVEGRPDPGAGLIGLLVEGEVLDEGEVAGRRVREDLAQRLLVGIGQAPVLEDVVESAGVRIACPRLPRPLMLCGRMVEDEVDADRDAALAQRARDGFEIVHRADRRVDPAVVHHGVAAVRIARPGHQAGHEVDIGDAELAEIVEVVEHALERAGEAVDVEDVAHLGLALEPVRLEIALEVLQPQRLRPGGEARRQHEVQPVQHRVEPVEMAVEAPERPCEVLGRAGEAQREGLGVALGQAGESLAHGLGQFGAGGGHGAGRSVGRGGCGAV